jgi:hypothetical protein
MTRILPSVRNRSKRVAVQPGHQNPATVPGIRAASDRGPVAVVLRAKRARVLLPGVVNPPVAASLKVLQGAVLMAIVHRPGNHGGALLQRQVTYNDCCCLNPGIRTDRSDTGVVKFVLSG